MRLEDQADGENSGTWGSKTDNNFALVEQAIAGRVSLSVAGAGDTTLTATNGVSDQARNAIVEITGVVTGNANIIVPTQTKKYTIYNNTSGAFTRTVKTVAGSGILVPQGRKMLLYCDGANVVEDLSAITSLHILGAIDETVGANIASAATTTIWATDGNYVTVTGTVTITSFGTAARAGARRKVKFSGALILTNGANLILPTGANITTVANDVIEVVAETVTQHRVVSYTRADGTTLIVTAGQLPANVALKDAANTFTLTNTFAAINMTALSATTIAGTTGTFSGTLTGQAAVTAQGILTAQAAFNEAASVDVASAATTNIGAAASSNVRITGVVTITAFDSVASGIVRKVRFAGALTLTHNAASLILPGTANIATAADDTAIFQSLGSGNWLCLAYKKADGTAIVVAVGAGTLSGNNAWTGTNSFNRTDTTTALTSKTTDAGAAEHVGLDLYRDSATAAANDLLESLLFSGNSATPTKRTMVKLLAKLLDATNASEDAELHIATIVAGALADAVIIGQGLQVGAAPTGGDEGAGTVNVSTRYYMGGSPMLAPDALSGSGSTAASPAITNNGLMYIASGAGFTLTLPTLASVFNGYRVGLYNNITSGSCVANRTSTDTIISQGTSGLIAITLPSKSDMVWFIADKVNSVWVLQGTRSFESTEITLATSVVDTQAHSLGVVPKYHQLHARNKTAELGYTAGDEVVIGPPLDGGGSGRQHGLVLDATNGVTLLGTLGATSMVQIENKTTPAGVISVTTAGNWKIFWRATVVN